LASALDPAFVWAIAKHRRHRSVVDVVVHENTQLSRKPAPFRSFACVAVTPGVPGASIVHRSGTLSTWQNSGSLLACTVSGPSKHRAYLVEIRPRDWCCFPQFIFDQYPPSNLLRITISPCLSRYASHRCPYNFPPFLSRQQRLSAVAAGAFILLPLIVLTEVLFGLASFSGFHSALASEFLLHVHPSPISPISRRRFRVSTQNASRSENGPVSYSDLQRD
jgi:hypothetical protein